MRYRAERNDLRLDLECGYLVPSGYGTFIEANSDEEAKQKAVEWTLEKGEIIGDWIGERNDVMHASIASNRRKYHISNIVLYVKTDRISPYKWTPGIIIKDYNGIPLNSQLLYGERIKRTNIKRYVDIENGSPVKLPSDLEILGEKTSYGFSLTGLKFKDKIKHNAFE